MSAGGVLRAARLPRHQGPAAWNAILGPQPPATPLSGAVQADLAIVGGGFAGLSAARRFLQLQPGARVALLEAGRLAEGAAGRNTGFMIDLPHDLTSEDYAGNGAGAGGDRTLIDLNRQAIAFAAEAVRDYQINPNFFDPAGKVNGAASAAAIAQTRSYAAHLDSLGERHEWLDAQAMAELTGSSYYRAGLYTPGTMMLQPAGYVRGLAAGLAAEAAIYEQSAVRKIERMGPDWRLITKQGQVTAARVILANNGHLESFGIARGRLMQLFLYAAMTPDLGDAAPPGPSRWGVTPSDPMGTTMRRIDPGQGGHRIITRHWAALRSEMVSRPGDLARARRAMRAKFADRFPGLAHVAPEFEWAGHLCLTRNGAAITGEVEPGLIAAGAQNGLGTARGTLTGIAAAETAAGETSAIRAHFDAEALPPKLPPRPVRDLGANAVLRAKLWRARAE